MSAIYQEMLKKQTQKEALLQSGKRQYEYDSDEETEVQDKIEFVLEKD